MTQYYKNKVRKGNKSLSHVFCFVLFCLIASLKCVFVNAQVQNLKALLQHAHCEEETCEDREKITFNKKVKDKESTQVNERSHVLIPERQWRHFDVFSLSNNLILSQTRDADVSSAVLKAENETKELLAQNRSLSRKWEHQQEEIRRLNKVSRGNEKVSTSERRSFECLFPATTAGSWLFSCVFRL